MKPRILWSVLVCFVSSIPFLRGEPYVWDGKSELSLVTNSINWLQGNPPALGLGPFDAEFGSLLTNTNLVEQSVVLQQLEIDQVVAPLAIGTLTFTAGRPAYTFTAGNILDPQLASLRLGGDVLVESGPAVVFDDTLHIVLDPGAHTIEVGGEAILDFRGDISEQGAASIVKTGTGILILGGEPGGRSTFTGGFELQEGRLVIGRSSFEETEGIDTSPVGVGILTLFGDTTLAVTQAEPDPHEDGILLMNDIALPSGTAVIETEDTDLILSGLIGGDTGGIEKLGSGKLTLTNEDNFFSGGLTLTQGTLAVGGTSFMEGETIVEGPVGTGTLTLGRGTTLTAAPGIGNTTLHNTIVLDHLLLGASEGGVVFDMGEGSLVLYGDIYDGESALENPLPLVKEGPGVLVLGGYGNFSGGVTVSNGTLQLEQSSGDGGSHGPIGSGLLTLHDGTTLSAGVPASIDNAIEIVNGTVAFGNEENAESQLTLTGSISGEADLAVVGDVRLEGISDFTGNVTVDTGGTLTIGIANALRHDIGIDLNPEGYLNLDFDQTIGRFIGSDVLSEIAIASGAQFTIDLGEFEGSTSYHGDISGAGSLRIGASLNGSPVNLTGHISHTGGTFVDAGAALRIGNDEFRASISGNIANDGSLFLHSGTQDQPLFVDGVISGAGQLVVDAGVAKLGGDNTYTGGTIVHSGATLIAASEPGARPFGNPGWETNAVTVNAHGTLAVGSGATISNILILNSDSRLMGNGFINSATIANGAILSPGSRLDKVGTLTFNDLTLGESGVYEWNLLDPNNHSSGYDIAAIEVSSASLHIESSVQNPFEIRLITLNAPGSPGMVSLQDQTYTWYLFGGPGSQVHFPDSEFNPALFRIDTTYFETDVPFDETSFNLFLDEDNWLALSFTPVPEPSTYVLMLLGLAGLGVRAWKRRR